MMEEAERRFAGGGLSEDQPAGAHLERRRSRLLSGDWISADDVVSLGKRLEHDQR